MKVVQLFKSGNSSMTLQIDTAKLEILQKLLGVKYRVEVGILGNSEHNRKTVGPRMATERSATGKGRASKDTPSQLTNVQIGIAHEFGVKGGQHSGWKIPPRSFLWMPLTMNLMQKVNEKADVINKYLNAAKIKDCYVLLGIIAENVVQEAFAQGGPGWAPLAQSTKDHKGSDEILIDTGQLHKSITSRTVVD